VYFSSFNIMQKNTSKSTVSSTNVAGSGLRLLSDINHDISSLEQKINVRVKADKEFRAKYNKDDNEVSDYHKQAMRTFKAKMKTLLAEKDVAFRLERERPCEVCGVTALYDLCQSCYIKRKRGLLPKINTATGGTASTSTVSSQTSSPAAMDVSEEEASETQSTATFTSSTVVVNKNNNNNKVTMKNECEDCGNKCRGRWCDDCWTQWKDEQRAERKTAAEERQRQKIENAKALANVKPAKCRGHNCPNLTTRYFCLPCHRINQQYVLR